MPTTTVARAMGTGISRLVLAGSLVVAISGCGGRSAPRSPVGWLTPAASPPAWPRMTIGRGATISYPPGWRRVRGDSGTASAMLVGGGGQVLGYLNLTPRQGHETQAGWSRFRVEHNREEGERGVRAMRAASGMRFLTGRGACVQDSYTTAAATRYVEIACLIAGRRSSFVAVGAAPPDRWPAESAMIERAIEGVRG